MAENPPPTCWLSGGQEHCVITECGDDQTQASCDAKHANAVAVLMGFFPVDP